MNETNPEITAPQLAPERVAQVPRPWTIAADVVAKATQTLPEEQREAIRWLDQHCRTARLTLRDVASQIVKDDGQPYSMASLYAVLTGKRSDEGAGVERVCEAILRFKRRTLETAPRMSTGFIETDLSRLMFGAFRRALDHHRLSFVFGESQIGKTAAAVEFQRQNNHGKTVMIRMPTGGSLTTLSDEMSQMFGIARNNLAGGRRRVMDCFDESNLLIVDECQHALHTRSGISRSLEFLREIYDRRRCGMVLIGNYAFKGALENSSVLKQLWRRRSPGSVVHLPEVPGPRDIVRFAAAFGLPPAPEEEAGVRFRVIDNETGQEVTRTYKAVPAAVQHTILKRQGLGSWIKLLEDARDQAVADKKPMSWGRVLYTYCLAEAAETL